MSGVASVANEAALVLHATMFIQSVIVVEAFAAEATQWVALESSLVSSSGLIVAASHVLFQFLFAKELVFVRKDFFVARAQVTHALLMRRLDMAVQIGPS